MGDYNNDWWNDRQKELEILGRLQKERQVQHEREQRELWQKREREAQLERDRARNQRIQPPPFPSDTPSYSVNSGSSKAGKGMQGILRITGYILLWITIMLFLDFGISGYFGLLSVRVGSIVYTGGFEGIMVGFWCALLVVLIFCSLPVLISVSIVQLIRQAIFTASGYSTASKGILRITRDILLWITLVLSLCLGILGYFTGFSVLRYFSWLRGIKVFHPGFEGAMLGVAQALLIVSILFALPVLIVVSVVRLRRKKPHHQ